MKIYASILAIVAVPLLAFAAEFGREADNLLDAVRKPANQQDAFIRQVAQQLAKSQVPTATEADKLALDAFLRTPGLGAEEASRVTGLYRISRPVPQFVKAGELVWEVRIIRDSPIGVAGVVWVSTTTKKVKVLFPAAP